MKKKKGITLISLIITIIVLLILAGVAISTLMEEDNTFSNANKTKEKYNNEVKKENIMVEETINVLNKEWGTIGIVEEIPEELEPEELEHEDIVELKKYTSQEIAQNKDGILTRILNNTEPIDYIIENCETYADSLIASTEAMNMIVASQYMTKQIILDSTWKSKLISAGKISMIDGVATKVPKLTGNSTSVIASSSYNGRWGDFSAWKAFAQSGSESCAWAQEDTTLPYLPQWIGYDFSENVIPYKIYIKGRPNLYNTSAYPTHVILEGFDGTEWKEIQEYTNVSQEATLYVNCSKTYTKLRIYITEVASGASQVDIYELQFYCVK